MKLLELARVLMGDPKLILLDEPAAGVNPVLTETLIRKIEELMQELKADYSILIVTHNMQQAARVSDRTGFFNVELNERGQRTGHLVEFDETGKIFTNPNVKATEDYITGRFG